MKYRAMGSGEEWTELPVRKYGVSRHGLKVREELPKTEMELKELGNLADELAIYMGQFILFYRFHPEILEKVFVKRNDKWVFVPPEPSPKKSR